ncbi:Uma2 family endonuclease [Salmonirosea aquatica]|uniref:Uma2 family endonuclease n=1 Tax=Salmonirosea aquatica TaxID=2654236 RepID=A0A7C9FPV2_9BACT|nr:Uma2 family endonuclease [Cytophagaceae bacterium SJW1-29]
MLQTSQTTTETLPQSLETFLDWEPNDGFKYEWDDGEIIQFTGMNKEQAYIYGILSRLFFRKGYAEVGALIAEQNVHLSGIQLRRPDIAYFTYEQLVQGKKGNEMIPAFVIEIISNNDEINKMERKLTEYFKAGVQIAWIVIPEEQVVNVYTSRRDVRACLENDICSAAPVLPDFEISVNDMLVINEA